MLYSAKGRGFMEGGDIMDISSMSIDMIPALSTALSTAEVQNQVNVALMAKSLNSFEESGLATIEMMRKSMELSVNPGIGANIDISI